MKEIQGTARGCSSTTQSLAKHGRGGLHRSLGFLRKQQLVLLYSGKLLITKAVEARGRIADGWFSVHKWPWMKHREEKAL